MLIGAAVVLVAYGAVWLSVRRQHPYSGPSGTALAVLYSTLIVWIVLVSLVFKRARSGVSGRSARQQRIDGAAFVTIWISVYVFQGALHHAGASHAIVYGIYPAAAPLVIVGSAAAAHMAAKENWRWLGFALAAVAIGAIGCLRRPGRRVGRRRHRPLRAAPRPRRAQVWLPAHDGARMTAEELDPLIHVPARLRIIATLAALPEGDTLSFTRLQTMIGLTPGNLITHLRKLEDAGYLSTEKTGNGAASRTSVALTHQGRTALDTYTSTLRGLLTGL